ncbi:hypothetical protein BT69DRAFT_1277523 [Atractiella rhizophila]|nr:hypothetical protein BT69DRAFT_1282580 [Atractiella rhizophila]KAH8927980.1 hypothetical protein BT69DRAFT_1277523 [Atractiella rhizophila]
MTCLMFPFLFDRRVLRLWFREGGIAEDSVLEDDGEDHEEEFKVAYYGLEGIDLPVDITGGVDQENGVSFPVPTSTSQHNIV